MAPEHVQILADPDELLAVGATARMAGVSNETIRRWEKQGALPAIRTPGGQRRFRRADVEALLGRGAA